MSKNTEILRNLSEEKFFELFLASTRASRETYFHRHDIKSPKKSNKLIGAGVKNKVRMQKLFQKLQVESDDEMAEEILRTWLYTKRSLLVAALDHLGIEHVNGLTESSDLELFEKVSGKALAKLLDVLSKVASKEDVETYLKFMGTSL